MSKLSVSLDPLVDYLIDGFWRDQGESPRHWAAGESGVITVDLSGLHADGKALARAALTAWESVADLHFKEIRGSADLRFTDSAARTATHAEVGPEGGIFWATVAIDRSWLKEGGAQVGSYAYQAYLHEIGHALGLGHSGDYNGSAGFHQARFPSDSWQATVMSYFDQAENPNVAATKAYVVTPMMADVLAIQQLYGRPQGGPTAGGTIWCADPELADSAMTIWDEGGTDRIDLARDGHDQAVDLRGGSFSSVGGQVGNLGIAEGTLIENVATGSGADAVTGNKAANRVLLGVGDDTASGQGGDDRMFGQEGRDTLRGGGGNDTLTGGEGADDFVFASGRDTVTDFENNRDAILFERDLWGGEALPADQVLDFAHVEGSDIVFDFGDGATLRIKGMTDIGALADSIAFV